MVRTVVTVAAVVAFAFGAAAGLNAVLSDQHGSTATTPLSIAQQPSLVANGQTPAPKATLGSPERPIAISETQFTVTVATRTLSPGKYDFAVKNNGTIEHGINFDGPNLEDASTGTLKPGASGTLTLTLAKGTYRVYCPMPKHKSMGMATTITVK